MATQEVKATTNVAGDLPNSIRVACASNGNGKLDGHFGSCEEFLIYQVSPSGYQLVEVRAADDLDAEDKTSHRVSLIADCNILFIASIGGPPAARVIRAGIHPIKRPAAGLIEAEMAGLSEALSSGVPPWLAKAMGFSPKSELVYDEDDETECIP